MESDDWRDNVEHKIFYFYLHWAQGKIYERYNRSAMSKKFPNKAHSNEFITNQNLPTVLLLPFSTAGILPKLSTYFSKEAYWDLDFISACFLLLYIHMVLIITLLFSEVGSLWQSWRRKVVQLINQNLWLLNLYHSLMTPVQEFCNIFLCCMFSYSILTCTDFFLHFLNSFILFYLKPFTF